MVLETLECGDYLKAEAPCPVCASHERRLLSKVGRNFEQLETVICTGCGLVHSRHIPTKDELEAFYRSKYRSAYKGAVKPNLKHTLRYSPDAMRRLKKLHKFKKPDQTTLLDIGSGSGEFLYMANKAGLAARGIEPHEGYSSYTRQVLGLNVDNTTLFDADVKPESVDIINLHHVLEHMPNPLETLEYIRSLLKHDGLLLLDVPNIAVRSHSPGTQFHYAHIFNFSYQTLKALAENAGFEVLDSENNTTNLVLKKVSLPISVAPVSMPENYVALWSLLTTHTKVNHYLTHTPYTRFLRKCFQYPYEILAVQLRKSPRQILDAAFDKSGIAGS